MNSLTELIGQTVTAMFPDEEGVYFGVTCKVHGVSINDWYFEEKNEPIYIELNLEPLEELPEGLCWESFIGVPLDNIYR